MNLRKIGKTIVLTSALLAASSHASIAHLTLNGTNGDWITLGQSVDNVYSSADPLLTWNFARFSNIGSVDAPATDYVSFIFLKSPWLVANDEFAILDFSTRGLGIPMITGVSYDNAERASFASADHPGLDITYNHRGCNTLNGSFILNELAFTGNQISRFSASFSQSCDGGALMNGTFFYDADLTSLSSNVPEPETLALLGLGLVGLRMTRRRK